MTDIRLGVTHNIRDSRADESYREWNSHDPLKLGLIFARPAYPFNALIAEVVVQVGYGKSRSLHTVASTDGGSTGDALWLLMV